MTKWRERYLTIRFRYEESLACINQYDKREPVAFNNLLTVVFSAMSWKSLTPERSGGERQRASVKLGALLAGGVHVV
jgi:hypothetical protein